MPEMYPEQHTPAEPSAFLLNSVLEAESIMEDYNISSSLDAIVYYETVAVTTVEELINNLNNWGQV